MDVDTIMGKQLKQMEKEMREKETKLRTQENP
jgi:DNA-binding protein YbaB